MSTSPVAMRLDPMSGGDLSAVKTLLNGLKIGYTENNGYLDTVEISSGDQNAVLQKVSALGLGFVPLCTVNNVDNSAALTKLTEELKVAQKAAQTSETARAAAAAALETTKAELSGAQLNLGKAEKALANIAKAVGA